MQFSLIYITCKDEEEASYIARNLVETGLVACANVLPEIRSIYKWEGKLTEEPESALILKTRKDYFPRVEEKIKELHSYDCPCILSFDIAQANTGFLDFIEKSTAL